MNRELAAHQERAKNEDRLTVEQLRDRLNLEIKFGNAAKPVVYMDRELGAQPVQTTLPLLAGQSFAGAPPLEETVVVLC